MTGADSTSGNIYISGDSSSKTLMKCLILNPLAFFKLKLPVKSWWRKRDGESRSGGGNIRPAGHIRPTKDTILAWNYYFWLKSGPWNTYKAVMWPAKGNSCPPLVYIFMLKYRIQFILEFYTCKIFVVYSWIRTSSSFLSELVWSDKWWIDIETYAYWIISNIV